ncbi:MAG: LamG domain-containing protein [Candidatus Micrarchaeaceae archaeon]
MQRKERSRNYKAFIFTLDAVFALIVASAAVSLLLYVHFTSPITPAAAPTIEALSVMHNMLSTQLSGILQSGVALPPLQAYKLPSSSEPFGYSGFLSNGSYISAPTGPVSEQSFTVSFWVMPIRNGRYVDGCNAAAPGGDNASVIMYFGNNANSIEIAYNSSGGIYVSGLNENCFASPPGSVPQNKWTNVVLRQNSTTDTLFINGIRIATTAASTTGIVNGAIFGSSLGGISSTGNLGDYNFTGYIANVQLYNSSLTPSKVYQLYKSAINSVPIGNSKLAGWWPLDSNANDYSGNGNDGIPHNVNFVITDYLPIGYYNASINESIAETLGELYLNNDSMYAEFLLNNSVLGQPRAGIYINGNYSGSESVALFNATAGSYGLVYNNSLLDVGKPNMTISAWVYPQGLGTCGSTTPTCVVVDKQGSYSLAINESGSVCIQLQGTSLGSSWNCSAGVIQARAWAQIGFTKNSSSANISYDGGILKSVYVTGNVTTFNGNTIVGATGNPGSITGTFNGSIANLEIYNVTLGPKEYYNLYLQGISGMALGNSSLVGWWPLDGNTNDYSGNGDAAVPYLIKYASIPFTPPSLVNAYSVSKSSVPIALKSKTVIQTYNLSVVIWR